MLGRELVRLLTSAGEEVRALRRVDLDVRDADACRERLRGFDVVVNASAWTAVDDAEDHEAEAFALNGLGPAHLAVAAAATGARLVHVSTDYVFDGRAEVPYGEDAATGPRSAYGRSKLAGEWAVAASSPDHLVVRTAWLYGDGKCFPRTVARLLGQRESLAVVDDQEGQPTWTGDLADLLLRLVAASAPGGLYHGTASGSGTWLDFAREVARTLETDAARVRATTSSAFPTAAERPAWSVLAHGRLESAGVRPIPDWRQRWRAVGADVLGDSVPSTLSAG